MVQFIMFFCDFLFFCLRLKFLKVNEGFLRDNIACYDQFMSYML